MSGAVATATPLLQCALHILLITSCTSSIFRSPVRSTDTYVVLLTPFPLIIFAWSGNLYHHIILAQLRSSCPPFAFNGSVPTSMLNVWSYTTRCEVPRRGWFLRAACPHYFFEVLAWFGFSVVVHRPVTYLVVITMALWLGGRSIRTRWWYQQTITGYPRDVRCMIPFVF